jgi:uncharacterized MnhB-related membrane protein
VSALQLASYLLVAAGATAVVLTRQPVYQSLVLALYGLLLTLLFVVLQAPDVALSQLTVGVVAVPLMLLVTLRRLRRWMRKG